jgi:hypothetical protein
MSMTNKQKRRMARLAMREPLTRIIMRGGIILWSLFQDRYRSSLWKWKKN